MIVKTNVKLNLGLSVLRKRADGFHDIETLFVPCFDFGDTIEIITGDDYSRSSAALFAKYGAPDGRFDASAGSATGKKHRLVSLSNQLGSTNQPKKTEKKRLSREM